MTNSGFKTLPRRRIRTRVAFGVVAAIGLGATALFLVGRAWLDPLAWSFAEQTLNREVAAMGGVAMPAGSATRSLAQVWGGKCYIVILNGRPVGDAGLAKFAGATGDPIVRLDLRNAGVTDAGLEHLAGKVNLDEIRLGSVGPAGADPARLALLPKNVITDTGLARLARMVNLRGLDLAGMGVTDAGLHHLKGSPEIVNLWLDRTRVAGPGLADLSCIPRLGMLSLDDTPFIDDGLSALSGATNLQSLSLRHAKIVGPGLAHLNHLRRLEDLDLSGCPLSTDALRHLAGPVPIKDLALSDVPLGRASLDPLKDPKVLPRLEKLNLRRTGLTDPDVADLRKSRPGLKVLLVEPAMVLDPRGFYLPAPD